MTQTELANIRQLLDHVSAMNNQAAQVRMDNSNWTRLLDELMAASRLLANALRAEEWRRNATYWRLPEDETPAHEDAQICVLYLSDSEAIVTTWADEKAERRIGDIAAWLPVIHPIELRREVTA